MAVQWMGPGCLQSPEETFGWHRYRTCLVSQWAIRMLTRVIWCPKLMANMRCKMMQDLGPTFQVSLCFIVNWMDFIKLINICSCKVTLHPCKEWWDHSLEAFPKKRQAEAFDEVHPTLETLAWSNNELKRLVLILFCARFLKVSTHLVFHFIGKVCNCQRSC